MEVDSTTALIEDPPKYILYYSDCYGHAEPMRLLLHYANVSFHDRRITMEEYATVIKEMADKLEFGMIPVLEDAQTGETFSQSISTMRMLAKLHGLYPEDLTLSWLVDSSIDGGKDVHEKFWDVHILDYMDKDTELTKVKKPMLREEYLNQTLPRYLNAMQKRIVKNMEKYPVAEETVA